MNGLTFEHAHEWPCLSCHGLDTPDDVSAPSEPPDSRCYATDCPVDLLALRELEAQVGIASSYLAGVLRICTVGAHDALTALDDAIAEVLAGVYEDAHVPQADIRLRIRNVAETTGVTP